VNIDIPGYQLVLLGPTNPDGVGNSSRVLNPHIHQWPVLLRETRGSDHKLPLIPTLLPKQVDSLGGVPLHQRGSGANMSVNTGAPKSETVFRGEGSEVGLLKLEEVTNGLESGIDLSEDGGRARVESPIEWFGYPSILDETRESVEREWEWSGASI
jgi:hypothetical protein